MGEGLLEAALAEAKRGRLVLPCEPRGKRPVTKHGLLDATADPATIQAQWLARPDANVAVRTGAESRLVVLDVDGEPGTESLRALERKHGALPRTSSVVTPRGGLHFLFEYPDVEVRNSAGRLGPGLDIRGSGGYVLRPPSVGANGRFYEVDDEHPPAPMPGWLLARLHQPAAETARPAPSADWVAIVRDGVPEGRRNDTLTRLVGHLLRKDVHIDLASELVQLVNDHCCRPPLPPDEVDRVVDSIAAAEAQQRLSSGRR